MFNALLQDPGISDCTESDGLQAHGRLPEAPQALVFEIDYGEEPFKAEPLNNFDCPELEDTDWDGIVITASQTRQMLVDSDQRATAPAAQPPLAPVRF